MNWLTLIPLSLAPVFAEDPVLTMDEAVKLAEEQAYGVRVARANADKAAAQVRQAQGNLGPQVTFTATGQRFDPRQFGTLESGSLSLGAQLPLDVAGSVRGGVRAARLGADAQALIVQSEQVGVRADVRSAYLGVLQADALLGVQREALANAQKRLELGRARFEVGVAPRFDVIRLEGEVAQAESAVIAAENVVRSARNALNNLLVRPIDTPFRTAPVPIVDEAGRPAADYVALAQRTRPELLAAERRAAALGEVARVESRGLAPRVGVGIQSSHNSAGNIFSPKNQTVAQVQATLPIWDSGITKARTRAAREDESAAKLQADQLRLAVDLQVRQAVIRVENARSQRAVAATQVATATEALRIANLRYENGEGILLDVTTAQQNLTAARAAQVAADYDLLIALAELRRAVGTDDLGSDRSAT